VTRLTPAERLLQELGITEPSEIDLEAIAFHLGARVRYRKLEGCEARIIGRNDAAIITIGKDCSDRRKRFSLAHEIGHWTHHKGQTLVCRIEETSPQGKDVSRARC
jgi:Zn-dependent peptidase ImmA (M78 family)